MKSRSAKIAAGCAAITALALGAAAIAGAGGAFGGGGDSSFAGPQAARAKAAALRATGGGSVSEVERDSEYGATYEVEVTKPDGAVVDVRLDGSYRVVKVEGDSETADGPDANDAAEPNDG